MPTSATEQQSVDLRFPIGKYGWPESVTPEQRREWLDVLLNASEQYRAAISGLTAEQLDTPYRPDGWTVRQVIHHVADSHMNLYIRCRLALTEENPTIKTYEEALWAELPDGKSDQVETSICLLDCMHKRLASLLGKLSEHQWKRTFQHPERGKMALDTTLGLYAWHCDHHAAHITRLRARMGW